MKEGKLVAENPLAMAKKVGAGIGKAVAGAKAVKGAVDKVTGKKQADTQKGRMAQKVAQIGGGIAKKGLKGIVNFAKDELNKATGGQLGKKKVFNSDDYADELVNRSSKINMSEYNEFYKELDKAAKAGKKAGDTITVGGKNIKLKSDPKKMSDLKDSDIEKIDALAQRIYELNQK